MRFKKCCGIIKETQNHQLLAKTSRYGVFLCTTEPILTSRPLMTSFCRLVGNYAKITDGFNWLP